MSVREITHTDGRRGHLTILSLISAIVRIGMFDPFEHAGPPGMLVREITKSMGAEVNSTFCC